jgi:hypothetical protein
MSASQGRHKVLLAARDPKTPRTGSILLPSWLVIGASMPISASGAVWIPPYAIKTKLYGVITTSTRYVIYIARRLTPFTSYPWIMKVKSSDLSARFVPRPGNRGRSSRASHSSVWSRGEAKLAT